MSADKKTIVRFGQVPFQLTGTAEYASTWFVKFTKITHNINKKLKKPYITTQHFLQTGDIFTTSKSITKYWVGRRYFKGPLIGFTYEVFRVDGYVISPKDCENLSKNSRIRVHGHFNKAKH